MWSTSHFPVNVRQNGRRPLCVIGLLLVQLGGLSDTSAWINNGPLPDPAQRSTSDWPSKTICVQLLHQHTCTQLCFHRFRGHYIDLHLFSCRVILTLTTTWMTSNLYSDLKPRFFCLKCNEMIEKRHTLANPIVLISVQCWVTSLSLRLNIQKFRDHLALIKLD